MKALCFFALLFFVGSQAYSQPTQINSEELEKRNGFKSIKLAESIDSVSGASLKKEFIERLKGKDEFPAKLYSVKHDLYSLIGEVRVSSIDLKTYKDLVYEIEVTTEKDLRVMKAMEMAFGKAIYNLRTRAYHWRANSLSLTFIGNKNSITLIYKSYPIMKMMYEDKGKKLEAIAEDF